MAQPPEKAEGAFRTIREVADWLGVPTHVLRFWESKFDEIAPVKGAGGRRYYRPTDMRLLGGIKTMLHDQGVAIRTVVQRIEEEGVDGVMALAPALEMPERTASARARPAASAPMAKPDLGPMPAADPEPVEETEGERVVPFARRPAESDPVEAEPEEAAPPPPPEEPAEGTEDTQLTRDDPMPTQPDVPDDLPDEVAQPVDREPVEATPEPPQPGAPPAPAPKPTAPAPDLTEVTARMPGDPSPSLAGAVGQAKATDAIPADRQRRLRRIVRKLRGLIEEVEEETANAPRG